MGGEGGVANLVGGARHGRCVRWRRSFARRIVVVGLVPLVALLAFQTTYVRGAPYAAGIRGRHHELQPLTESPKFGAVKERARIVGLDFEWFADEFERAGFEPNVNVTIGLHTFQCFTNLDKPTEHTNSVHSTNVTHPTGGELSVAQAQVRRRERKNWATLSKLASIAGSCLWYNPGLGDPWRYTVCVGREVIKYLPPRLLKSSPDSFLHFGHHRPSLDRISSNGEVIQYYTPDTSDGTGNPESTPESLTKVRYLCGHRRPRIARIREYSSTSNESQTEEKTGVRLEVDIEGFAFCDWRPHVDSRQRPPLDRLLVEGFGKCQNFTSGWWTYEYCHPDSFSQFHVKDDQTLSMPMFLLGGLQPRRPGQKWASPQDSDTHTAMQFGRENSNSSIHAGKGATRDAARMSVPTPPPVEALFPFVRGPLMPKTPEFHEGLASEFQNLPVEIITIPPALLASAGMGFWDREAGAKGLALYLGSGSPCPQTPQTIRTSRIVFFCPTQMVGASPTRPFRLLNVLETRTCQYDVLIAHYGLCVHPLLRPPFPELPESILCARKRTVESKISTVDGSVRNVCNPRAKLELEMTLADLLGPQGEDLVEARRCATYNEACLYDPAEAATALAHSLNWLPISSGASALLRSLGKPRGSFAHEKARRHAQTSETMRALVYETVPVNSSRVPNLFGAKTRESRDSPESRDSRDFPTNEFFAKEGTVSSPEHARESFSESAPACLFSPGDVVRHQVYGYKALIRSCDAFGFKGTRTWLDYWANVYASLEPRRQRLLLQPWYSVNLWFPFAAAKDTPDLSEPEKYLAYVPQCALRLAQPHTLYT